MNFGLDWDGTVNQAYALWAIWVREAIRAGHRVYVVTMRYPSEVDDYMRRWCFNNGVHSIIATARGAKRPAVERLGIQINVWIDDNPRAVEEHAKNIWGAATPEGEVVEENDPGSVRGDLRREAQEAMERGNDILRNLPWEPREPGKPYVYLRGEPVPKSEWTTVQHLSEENAALAAGQCCVPEGGLTADEGGTPYCAMQREVSRLKALDGPRIDKLNNLTAENAQLERQRDTYRETLEQECNDIDQLLHSAFGLRPSMTRTEGGRLRVKHVLESIRLQGRTRY